MRRLIARLGSLCLLALLTAGCQRTLIFISTPTSPSPVISPAAERTATIQQLDGTVETRTSISGNWAPAIVNRTLAEGAQIRTAAGSHALIGLTEGSHVYLGPNTQFTLTLLNPFLDSQLTTIDLQQGQVWVLLKTGALDVKTPFGIASARGAYLSVELLPQSRSINVTCLQGVCGFGTILIPGGYKLANAADNQSPQQMQMADYGVWGVAVPEATQLAYLATEAVAQGSATIPAVASPTATASPPATVTQPPTATATRTLQPTATDTLAPNTPSATVEPPTATLAPSSTPLPSPTLPEFQPTVTAPPFTPLPAFPIIGQHIVQPGETIFCIARGYGVLPAAIAQANGLSQTFLISSGQVLRIPAAQWVDIAPGPVCPPQFASPFPGLSVPTATLQASPTPAGPPLAVHLSWRCIANCGSKQGTYQVHVDVLASGGVTPYNYNPAQSFDVRDLPHCVTGQSTVTVTSADGQTARATWTYVDSACP